MRFPVILTTGEDGYVVAQIPVVPGCISQGKDEAEALENIREALILCLDSARDEGWVPPDHYTIEELEVAV